MRTSLQKIEDRYIRRGFRGKQLQEVLRNDHVYQAALKSRKGHVKTVLSVKGADQRKYVLSTDDDFEILGKIYTLESERLTAADRALVKLIRTQLEHDWRRPLLTQLNKLLRKYQ